MPAVIKEDFEKSFLLKEENIRRIHDIIKKRLNEKEEKDKLYFRVTRKDHLTYTEKDIGIILNESNSNSDKIEKIDFFVNNGKRQWNDFQLTFDKKDGIQFYFEHEDRDLAYLLYSDLKSYINSDVALLGKIEKREDLTYFIMMMIPLILLCITITAYPMLRNDTNILLDKGIESKDIIEKLNALMLYNKYKVHDWGNAIAVGMTPLYIIAYFGFRWVKKKYYPKNIFHLGKEIEKYEELLKGKSNFYWGVVVATIVSIVASVIYAKLFN